MPHAASCHERILSPLAPAFTGKRSWRPLGRSAGPESSPLEGESSCCSADLESKSWLFPRLFPRGGFNSELDVPREEALTPLLLPPPLPSTPSTHCPMELWRLCAGLDLSDPLKEMLRRSSKAQSWLRADMTSEPLMPRCPEADPVDMPDKVGPSGAVTAFVGFATAAV